jgi:hypothetical protein
MRVEGLLRQCKVGMKALHNMIGAANGFHLLLEHHDNPVAIVPASIFHWAVIRYSKPFLNHNIDGASVRYKESRVTRAEGFDLAIHQHLLAIRNTLIAHDDLDAIPPRLLMQGMEVNGSFLPVSVRMSNKSISRPSDKEAVEAFKAHASAAVKAIYGHLKADVGELKSAVAEDPAAFFEGCKYQGKAALPPEGGVVSLDQHNAWLDMDTPDFSSIHNGFIYETSGFEELFDYAATQVDS